MDTGHGSKNYFGQFPKLTQLYTGRNSTLYEKCAIFVRYTIPCIILNVESQIVIMGAVT